MGAAEVVMTAPPSSFDDVVAMGEVCAAKAGVESVVVLNWKLLREVIE